ncbi:XrtV sorting system accessory protein [Sphingomonas profundi]|uniref:XrtV sorting system accessory protein n=1 Tax=Alterirhizorhabdus profundi TaxID=2681549 RepID=UPI0012E8D0DF|nr:XrtV sorting system accessory protein [Sphingomonas profundi]
METIYDWLSLAVFAGLVVLLLQRSTADTLVDSMWHYLPPALGCAGGNWLGNHGYHIPAVIALVGTLAYIHFVLRPFSPPR